MENTITLDSLIQQGNDIHRGIRKKGYSYIFWNDMEFSKWKNTAIRFLADKYKNDRALADFESAIAKFEGTPLSPESFAFLVGVLEGIRRIPNAIKKPITASVTASAPNVVIHNSNSQSQTQSQQQTQLVQIFIEAIKDELTDKQQKELKAITKENLPEDSKRTKIIDKLKSFGSDTLSNIISNIITNPAIWG